MVGVLVLAGLAGATTWTVGSGGGYDYSTIQAAISDANTVDGDMVVVYPGTYNEAIRFDGKNIIVTSTNPDDPNIVVATIVDPNASKYDPNSAVSFDGTEGWIGDVVCELRGGTITGGYAGDGEYEIDNEWDSDARNCGGGIKGNGANADIISCVIEYNHADGRGGGIWKIHGNITNCTIRYNTAQFYYRYNSGSEESPVWKEAVFGRGGGIAEHYYVTEPKIHIISNCVIEHNTTNVSGGGLYQCNQVVNSVIRSNSVELMDESGDSGGGGAFSCYLKNCDIEDNEIQVPNPEAISYLGGGGLFLCEAKDCIIRNNNSNERGGGLSECMHKLSDRE